LGSSQLVFEPSEVQAGEYQFNIGTAGATSLVLQALYLPLALRGTGPSRLTLVGGTHVNASPCFHFLETTWKRYSTLLGLRIELDLQRPGFYPRGGGIIKARIDSCQSLKRFQSSCHGRITEVRGFSAVAGLPEHIAQRQARQAAKRLRAVGLDLAIDLQTWEGGPGSVLGLELPTQPVPTLFFGLGARGKSAERVADEAVDQVVAHFAAPPGSVDLHSADQILLPLAFAAGASQFQVAQVTLHLLTNLAVIRWFLEREMTCEGAEGEPGLVTIR
jgi:RNA 3'-terminal phosphate cyclase (ATP)